MAEKRPMTLDDFWSLKTVSDVRLSPDGATVAYVVGSYDEARNAVHSAIWLAALSGDEPRRFTSGEAADMTPRWSPDGRRLAFVSTRHEGKPQIFVIDVAGGEPRRLTNAPEGAYAPLWSPDGARLCYTSDCPSDRQEAPQEAAWLEAHTDADQTAPRLRRQTSLASRVDGRGYIDRRAHLFVVPVNDDADPTATPRQLTDGDYDAAEAAWSPDGALIAFVSNRADDAEHTFASDIWTVDVDSGALTALTDGTLMAAAPTWSPDGETAAFYAAPDLTRVGHADTHLWAVSRRGGDGRDLSAVAGLDRAFRSVQSDYHFPSAQPLTWAPDGRTILFLSIDHGDSAVYALDVAASAARRVTPGPIDVVGLQCAPDGGSLVLLAATPSRPFDLFVAPMEGGAPQPLVETNRALLDEIALVEPARVTWKGPDSWDIEGWLYSPRAAAPEQPYPLILHVHGGPYGAWGNAFLFQAQAFAEAGYASFYVNPRGSLGYGQDFSQAADWGEKDFGDLMAGIDCVLARGRVDPARLGMTGISYGGFMTNWALGHTDRFAAGVSVNGVSNQISMYGTSDMSALWLEREYGGPYWAGEEQWRRYWRHSPIASVDRITTPLLLLQSENDYRCPIEQGEQLLTALRVRRRTVELVRFPGCSHVIAASGTPLQRYLQWKLALDWFGAYLKPAGQSGTPVEDAEEGGVTVAAAPVGA